MKAILEFELPEEKEEYDLAVNGANYNIVLASLDNWLRHMYKYENKTTIKIEEVRLKINDLMREYIP